MKHIVLVLRESNKLLDVNNFLRKIKGAFKYRYSSKLYTKTSVFYLTQTQLVFALTYLYMLWEHRTRHQYGGRYESNTAYSFSETIMKLRGTRWCSCLGHCATSQKVKGSIPDGVIGSCHWHNPSCRNTDLELTQPLTEMSTRNISWVGVKATGV